MSRRPSILTAVLLVVVLGTASLLLTACPSPGMTPAPTPPPSGSVPPDSTAAPTAAPTEVPTETPTEAPTKAPTKPPIVLELWVENQDPEGQAILQGQLKEFNALYPDIQVNLVSLSYADMQDKLRVLLAAGGPFPDVIGAWSRLMTEAGSVLFQGDIFNVVGIPQDQFIPEALAENQAADGLYALPWYRDPACSPDFTALGLVAKSEHRKDASALINFLADVPRQTIGTGNSWYPVRFPTRIDAYKENKLVCPPTGLVATLQDDDQLIGRLKAVEAQAALQTVLDDQVKDLQSVGIDIQQQALNPDGATAALYYPGVKGRQDFGSESETPPPTFLAVAVPVKTNLSAGQFDQALKVGVIVGSLTGMDEPLEISTGTGSYKVDPGETYAVMLRDKDGQATLYLVNQDEKEYEIGPADLQDTLGDAGVPYVTVEFGSCTIRYHIDSKVLTVTVKNWQLGFKLLQLRLQGATILSQTCN